jgi:hypothetical protein
MRPIVIPTDDAISTDGRVSNQLMSWTAGGVFPGERRPTMKNGLVFMIFRGLKSSDQSCIG